MKTCQTLYSDFIYFKVFLFFVQKNGLKNDDGN